VRRFVMVAAAVIATLAGSGPAVAAPADPGIILPPLCVRHVAIGDRAVYEGTPSGDGSYTSMTFSVTSTGCARGGQVNLTTFGGTALSGIDYLPVSGYVVLPAGSLATRYVTIRVIKDGSPGDHESLFVVLSAPSSGVILDDAVGEGTIVNDDNACAAPPGWLPQPPLYPDYHCSE
jgi:hypothetical protein